MRARVLLLFAACGSSAVQPTVPKDLPKSRGCRLPVAQYGVGLHSVELSVHGTLREYLLFLPTGYQHDEASPLWVLAPGAYETAWRFLHISRLIGFAEKMKFAFAALEGAQPAGMNVGRHTQPMPNLPDDVEYTKAVLRHASGSICVNMNRIRCTGYSRGARFCVSLASELSSFVKGIAPVAGLRYPSPNNATWPMPIIAIHGTKDLINPYWGGGDPTYWHSSVPDAVKQWAKYNGCKYNRWVRKSKHVVLDEHFDCHDDASVVLVMIEEGGHTWPGSHAFKADTFGYTTQEVSANDLMFDFFMRHPRKSVCRIAREGDACHGAVVRAMQEGPDGHPEWSGRLTHSSSFEDYQLLLHEYILADCARPCSAAVQLPTIEVV